MIKTSKNNNSKKVAKNTVKNTAKNTVKLENKMRPQSFKNYIGQEKTINNINISIKAAEKRNEAFEHMLFYGPPGLGKTSLGLLIAKETGLNIKITSGPSIEKQSDLASILSNLKAKDILFIDEIHRLRAPVEELLYSAMEDFALDIMVGKGPSARAMRIKLPQFSLIGATTKLSMLSSPLRDRFGHILKFEFYNQKELEIIINNSSRSLNFEIDLNAAELIASCSRGTPRIANRILKRARDNAQIIDCDKILLKDVKKTLIDLEIDNKGLHKTDRDLIRTIIDKHNCGPVGLNTISAILAEEEDTIEQIYEPFLLQQGFLERTPRGRIVTDFAIQYFENLN